MKIRGHRIEPVEVEHALAAAFPQGQCCVVVVAEGDGKELAAFLALRDPAIDTAVVRRALEGVLMAAMVPRHIHFVDRFELDNNGKVDRARLRALHASVAISVATSPEPQHHDDALATIWSQALKLATVDEGTHFFDAGGDSFKALRCIAKINSRFGTELDIAMLYQAPTLGLMRANVGASVGALHDPIAVLGQPLAAAQNLVPSLVLVHALDGDFAPYGELTLSLMSSHRILALTQTRLQSSEQHAALDGLAREYASALCERYGLTAGATVVGWSFGGVLAYALCEQLQLLGMPPARLVMLDSDFADGQALSDAVELPAAASATLMRSAHWRGNMDRWQGYRPSTPLDFAVDYVEATASIDEPGRRRAT